jgi:hypothetical protein
MPTNLASYNDNNVKNRLLRDPISTAAVTESWPTVVALITQVFWSLPKGLTVIYITLVGS